MSQDYVDDVYDSTFVVQTTMANVEKNFAALKSAFSGAAAPSNLIAGMWWYDTTANILKLRNEANNAWQSVWDFANNKPVIANLSNEITGAMIAAALKDPIAATAGLRTIGTTALAACAGNDARLSDTRLPPDAGISQAKLKTSSGAVSVSIASFTNDTRTTNANLALPGGEYGFYAQLKANLVKDHSSTMISSKVHSHIAYNLSGAVGASYVTNVYLYLSVTVGTTYAGSGAAYSQQRYVTASGEVHWIFILRDKTTKQTISMFQAPDHPCFGNGGKPLLVPHPFGSYDETKYEIIVINPSLAELEQMELETIVEDESLPDKCLLQVISENYEIDESSNPAWPSIPITVGLPKYIKDKKGKKILADYRFMKGDTIIEPVKKIIPKPDYIKVRKLKKK